MYWLSKLHWLSILYALIAYMVIYMIWYSPFLFGRKWNDLAGITIDKARKQGLIMMVAMLVLGSCMVFMLDMLILACKKTYLSGSLKIGVMVAAICAITSLLENLAADKPILMWVINASVMCISIVTMSVVLVKF